MQDAHLSLLMRALKGPAAACLMALSLVEQPVTARWLAHSTGYSPNTITRTLRLLEELGLAAHDGRRSGWRSLFELQRRSAGSVLDTQGDAAGGAALEGERALSSEADEEVADCDVADCDVADCDVANCDALKLEADSLKLINTHAVNLLAESGTRSQIHAPPATHSPPELRGETTSQDFLLADSAEAAPRLLQAAEALFGEPVAPLRGQRLSARIVLAWVAQAYDQRHRLRKPARVIYAGLKRGEPPAQEYLDDPLSHLPERYLEAAGLRAPPELESEPLLPEAEQPTRAPGSDPPPEPHPSLGQAVSPGSRYSAQQAWQQALEVALQQAAPGPLRQHLQSVELLLYDAQQGVFTALAQDAQAQQLLQERMGKLLQRWLQGICQREVVVRFESPPRAPP